MKRSVMVFGGNGSLGKSIVSAFKAKSWRVLSVDINKNSDADENLLISSDIKMQA
jgi:NAD(P)-dependent dehydrogenase (short-subunit alcohol dehydrogenase family)